MTRLHRLLATLPGAPAEDASFRVAISYQVGAIM